MGDFIFFIIYIPSLLLITTLIYFTVKHFKNKATEKRYAEQYQIMASEVNSYLDHIKEKGCLPNVKTDLLLKSKEKAFLTAECFLFESRSTRKYVSGHAGYRLTKNVYVGGSRGQSEGYDEIKEIDSGCIVLTNTRIFFDGSQTDRNVPISKIVSVSSDNDFLEISSETRQKSMYFSVENPYIWHCAIKILSLVDGCTENIPQQVDVDELYLS